MQLYAAARPARSAHPSAGNREAVMSHRVEREAAASHSNTSAAGHIEMTHELAEGFTGLFKQLTLEHAEILELLLEVQNVAEPAQRQRSVGLASALLTAHEEAEREVLYPRLRGQKDLVSHADAHEEDASKLLRVLDQITRLPVEDQTFGAAVHQLVAMLQQHARLEETTFFPAAQRYLGSSSEALLQAYVDARAARLAGSRS
jgi:hemerythrin superfamily protein